MGRGRSTKPPILRLLRRVYLLGISTLVGAVLMLPTAAWSQTERLPIRPLSQAERDFYAGQQSYRAGEFDTALAQFKSSFQKQPSPNSRLYIARCMVELGQKRAAYDEYRAVIVSVAEQENPARYALTQRAATAERAALRQHLGALQLVFTGDVDSLSVSIDGTLVDPDVLGDVQYLDPGDVTVSAEAPGYAAFERKLELSAGEVSEVSIVLLRPVAPPPEPSPAASLAPEPGAMAEPPGPSDFQVWALVSTGGAVVGFGAFGLLQARAHSRFDRIEADCRAGNCPTHEIDSGRTETTLSHVGLAAGFVGLAAGVTFWILDQKRSKEPGLSVGVAPSAVRVSGTF